MNSNGWAKRLGKTEFEQLHKERVEKIVCAICFSTIADEGYILSHFYECSKCDVDTYYCSVCLRSAQKRHAKLEHEFEQRNISRLQSRDEHKIQEGTLIVDGMCKEWFLEKSRQIRNQTYSIINGAMHLPSNSKTFVNLVNASYLNYLKKKGLTSQGLGKIAPILLFCIELACLAFEHQRNTEQTRDEFQRKLAQSVVSMASLVQGAKMGSRTVKIMAKNVNRATKVTRGCRTKMFGIGYAIMYFIGSMLGSIALEKATNRCFNIFWPNQAHEDRELMVKEALLYFGFVRTDLESNHDHSIFNECEIRRRYRNRAKEAHPDRPGGSDEKFQLLNVYFGVLLEILHAQHGEGRDEPSKEYVSRTLLEITL